MIVKKRGYTIVEITIIIIVLSIILSLTINIRTVQNVNNIKKTIDDIQEYTSAIKTFKRKYGFLPGDVKKTQIFELSTNNTDGNENGLIEDKNQQNNIYEKNIKMDGEIANFWLHLYKSGLVKEDKNIFPYIDFLKTGILVFSNENKNYYHLGINGINENKEIETINSLTPYYAYLIDRKLDDGIPFSGKIQAVGDSKIKASNEIMQRPSKNCATEFEYLTVFKTKLCQLIIEIDI